MPDVEPVKGKVIIEYDGGGIDAAKKDLASLADIVGGGLAESVGGANESLSSLDEQMGKSADSTGNLVSSVSALEKPLQQSSAGIATVSEALGSQQVVLSSVGTAFESIQRPIEGTTALLENASPPMLAIAQSAESMQKQMSGVNDGFVQIGESLSQSVPLLPQFASSLHDVSAEFDPREFGLDTFNENMAVFQDALSNPYPFSMIHQHLTETGQTWDDFSSSIGDDNVAFLEQMAAMPVESEKAFGAMSSGVESVGQSFSETASQTEEFNKSWNDMAGSIGEVGQAGGMGTMLLGPEESWSKLDNALASTEEGLGKIGTAGGELAGGGLSFGDMFGGLVGGLEKVAMPLFAVQMIGYAVSAVGQGIYNMAALAEGPAAHSIGSFTGAVDQLGQHSQAMGEQLSESFGQGVKPMLDAINNVSSQSSGGSNGIVSFLSDFVAGVGGGLDILGDLAQIGVGGIVGGAAKILTLNPGNTTGNDLVSQGWEGLQNMWAQINGQPEPYPSPGGGGASSVQIDLPAIQASITQQIAVMNAQANNPGYLAANALLQSQAGYAQIGQTSYDASHMVVTGFNPITGEPTSYSQSPFSLSPQAYQNSFAQQVLATGGVGMGLSDVDLNRLYFTAAAQRAAETETYTGCFPAGTPVLLADGSTQAIETLRVGEQVLAHDGTKQVVTTILALIKPPPKQVYTLALLDGNTLSLTDSHPISTAQGWKSLSPINTRKENPDLAVTTLQTGDLIHTFAGTSTLVAIEPREIVQVYNITVGDPHTFYACGVLVHNKASFGAQAMQNIADSSVPQMDMKNSNLIQSMMSNFSDADLNHTFTATVSWAATGLSNTFTGAASWIGQNLSNAFTGVASWAGQGLSNAFTGVASWIGQNLSNVFTGAASWVGQNLSNVFTGAASWIGTNLEHTFTGVADWTMQQVTQVVGSIPGFAAGVEGFAGGLAVVGEKGPELAYLPQGTSIYPQSVSGGFQPLNMGNESGSLSITINHTTVLDGKVVAQETIPYIAPILRSVRGVRQ